MQGEWRTVCRWEALDTRWPHELAMTVLLHMRYLADAGLNNAQWTTLTGPIAGALPPQISRGLGLAGEPAETAPRRAPDGLAALLEAGLVEEASRSSSTTTPPPLARGGVLHHRPGALAVSAVNALAAHLCGYTANGWHLWRRARDNRLLTDLRTELATR